MKEGEKSGDNKAENFVHISISRDKMKLIIGEIIRLIKLELPTGRKKRRTRIKKP